MTHRTAFQRRLLSLVRQSPRVQVQNRLMACTDRDVALSLTGMSEEEADAILSCVSSRKAERVREERRLADRRHLDEKHIVFSINVLIASLQSDRAVAGRRSYLRPRRPLEDRRDS